MKNIIVALDGMNKANALSLAEDIKEYIWGVKLNDLLDQEGVGIITDFRMRGIKVFADPKLKDIPNTVKNRIKHYEDAGANFVTVCIDGGSDMLKAARDVAVHSSILGVTVLTSLSDDDSFYIYHDTVREMVDIFAEMALNCGLDGVICSPKEIEIVNKYFDSDAIDGLLKVVPGIRPSWYLKEDDQKRFTAPKEAIDLGANYIVIGRPITQAVDSLQAAKLTYEEVKKSLDAQNMWKDNKTPKRLKLEDVNKIFNAMDSGASFKCILNNSMCQLGINDEDCARMFDVSRTTVTRWRNGSTAPHKAMRGLIFKTFKDQFAQIKKY